MVLNFTIKPIIYGSLISKILKLKTINTLDGLGATFSLDFKKKIIIYFLLKQSQRGILKFFCE